MSILSHLGRFLAAVVSRVGVLRRAVIRAALDPGVLARLLEDRRFLARFFENAAFNPLLEKLLTDKRFLGRVYENAAFDPFLEKLLADKRFLTRLFGNAAFEPLLQKLMGDGRFLPRMIESQEAGPFLRRLLADRQFPALLLNDKETWRQFSKLLEQDDVIDRRLAQGLSPSLRKVISDERFAAYVNQDKELWKMRLTTLLGSKECLNRLREDAEVWETYSRALQDPGVYARLLDVPFFERLFSLGNLARLITAQEETMRPFSKFAGQRVVLRKLAEDAAWVTAASLEPTIAEGIFGEPAFLSRAVLPAQAELKAEWEMLLPALAADIPDLEEKRLKTHRALKGRSGIRDAILDVFCDQDRVRLAHGVMRFPDRRTLWILLHELLVDEEYYFESPTDEPVIIDAGAHFGLATYYFKSRYPKARILVFEPVPELRQLIEENVAANSYESVRVLPYALSDTEGDAAFLISEQDSMAGSLTERRRTIGDNIRELRVPCRRLSEYLDEEIHFLKLDIEGAEDRVLEEAASKLSNVRHLLLEYHEGLGLPPGRLVKIVTLLHDHGFELQIAPALSFQKKMAQRPITWIGKPYSALIWGSNRRYST